jgi:pimeloyl-ACP methyl ester carboxylesterase
MVDGLCRSMAIKGPGSATGGATRDSLTKVGRLDRPKGASIYYEVTGSGPPIVFPHGLSGSHLSWWQQVPYFSGRYTCITFSHRGWGLSTDAPDGPHTTEFADDLAALVDHLKLARVRLIAQSMGGWTCLAYALRHRDKVRGLVLAGTAGGLDPSPLAIDQDAAKARGERRAQWRSGVSKGLPVSGWRESSLPCTSCTTRFT